MNLRNLVRICVFVLTAAIAVPAQSNGKLPIPFNVGETFTYEGKISRIIQGISVADLSFTLAKAPNGEDYVVRTEAKSKGTLIKLFRFSFFQKYETTIDNEIFRVLKTTKRDEQKERIRDSEATFDYSVNQVTFIETNPNDPMRPPRKIASEIKPETHDIVSGLYALRMLPLAVGKTFEINVSDSGLVYRIPIRVAAREMQKSVLGRMMCFRVEPDIFGPNRLIEQKGSMAIWITDDARRIPVRSRISTELGRLEVRLRSIK
jgi:hypothetical protein